ncbi:DUF2202 domain-containing protein [Agromyces kandeliae]|uniref:DUF2202 domain-containing protein n=1 Tax=Agromyces kandeliae TaxID=2666141 RepID=A0A6L5R2T5_9MICO|nr:DUF2202 domain-containing protein [Agromyces kandeliae]MRX43738.1 DUF2202 domain-containing protein [Agromyces kandeliae]
MPTRRSTLISTVAAIALAGSILSLAACTPSPTGATSEPTAATSAEPTTPAPEASAGPAQEDAFDTAAALRYLIEEEKLAHDVYVVLGDLWGAQVFTNITASETTHQDLVAPLLAARGIEDPRSGEVGVFTDPDLQALYDELVARGSTSLDEAIQVGIAIEEKDLADLGAVIDAEDEADVTSVLERLYAGSENHLASFERLA